MKRIKRIGILMAVLIVACIATLVLNRYEEKQEQIKASDAIILALPQDTVNALSWQYNDGTGLAFHYNGTTWEYDDDEAFPVSGDKVSSILSHFEQFGVKFIIEDVEDFGQYGLDEPEATLNLATESETYAISLGDFSQMDSQRYISIGDGNVYLVEDDPMEYMESELSSMVQHDTLPDLSNVKNITFSGDEDYSIFYAEDSEATYNSEDDLYFTLRNEAETPLDTTLVKRYIRSVTNLGLTNYATYNASEEELESFGMNAPALTIQLEYEVTEDDVTTTDTVTVYLSENVQERADADQAEADGKVAGTVTKYARIGQSQIIYTLTESDYTALCTAGFNDLRHKEVFWADFSKVTGMDITLDGETHVLEYRQKDAEDEKSDYAWFYGDEEISISTIEYAVEDLTATEFTSDSSDGKEEIAIIFHLDDANFPEVEIQLLRQNATNCMAIIDGVPTSLVLRSAVMELTESVNAIILGE